LVLDVDASLRCQGEMLQATLAWRLNERTLRRESVGCEVDWGEVACCEVA